MVYEKIKEVSPGLTSPVREVLGSLMFHRNMITDTGKDLVFQETSSCVQGVSMIYPVSGCEVPPVMIPTDFSNSYLCGLTQPQSHHRLAYLWRGPHTSGTCGSPLSYSCQPVHSPMQSSPNICLFYLLTSLSLALPLAFASAVSRP